MAKDFDNFIADWERRALEELSASYRWFLRERRLNVKPALLELWDSETFWGQWDPDTRTIRITRQLVRHHPWDHVLGVLKHEMAHQLVDELFGERSQERPHGEAFQRACRIIGVPAPFARATSRLKTDPLDWRLDPVVDEESERLLEKIRKLLALASSSNEHEAALAMNRARELFAKYNLEHAERSEFVHLVISTGSKRMEIHVKKILSILISHFFVEVISGTTFDVRSGEQHRMFEIIGRRENVLMAEYVYYFLLKQSDLLAEELLRAHGVRSSKISRKSFRLGVLQGFREKLRAAEMPTTSAPESNALNHALVAFQSDRQLQDYIETVYRRLRTTRQGSHTIDSAAFRSGKVAGQKLTLNKPVSGSSGSLGKLLSGR